MSAPPPFLGHRRNRQPLSPTQHIEGDAATDFVDGERAHQIVGAGNDDPVKPDDDVAGPQPGALGGRIRLDGADHDRAVLGQSGGATA